MEVKDFGTMTRDLLALADWLTAVGITHVAMESTGEYWRPVYNLLEGNVTIFLVNAAHVKQVPGRKTDKADARWLAKLMRYGLLQASFIPSQGQRGPELLDEEGQRRQHTPEAEIPCTPPLDPAHVAEERGVHGTDKGYIGHE